MDENTIQAINDAYEKFKNAILEAYSAIVDAVSPALNEIEKIVRNAIESVEKREKERSKWRTMKTPKIMSLMLDKRSKIHRCRNAI